MEAAFARAKALLASPGAAPAAEAVAVLAPWQDSGHAHATFLLGAALQRLERLPDAASAYERALVLEPALIFARVNLVHVLLSQQLLPAAQAHAEEAVMREPAVAERHFMLALVAMASGDDARARAALQRCVVLDPRKVEAYVNLDALYLRAGDTKACRALAALAMRQARLSGGAWVLWTHELQRPPHMLPGLRAQPWWDAREIGWTVALLEKNAAVIRAELEGLALENVKRRSAADGSLVSRGAWSECVLLSGPGVVHAENCARCPRTAALLLSVAAARECARHGVGEALFSALAPGTRLRPHCGSTNSRLTCHLGLVVPAGCGLRVGDETRQWEEGRCLVFDDSFEHEAYNDSDSTRIVLLVNFWHPELPSIDWRPLQPSAASPGTAVPFRA